MNTPDVVDRTLTTWLSDGPTRMPNHVLDSIVQGVNETGQRRSAWLPRSETTGRLMFAAAGLVAGIFVAVIGIGLLSRGGAFGPAAPPPTPSPAPTPSMEPVLKPQGGVLGAGTYFMDVDRHRFTFTLPADGWVALPADGGNGVVWESDTAREFLGWTAWTAPDGTGVFTDGCAWSTNFVMPGPGPGASDLAEAIAAQDGWTSTAPAPADVGGHDAVRVDVTIPMDVAFADCHGGEFRTWGGRFFQGQGQTDEMYIIELDGIRYVMFATYLPGSPPDRREQLRQIVESVEIEPI